MTDAPTGTAGFPFRLPAVDRLHRLLLWADVTVSGALFAIEITLAVLGKESPPQWYVYAGSIGMAVWQLRRPRPNALWLTGPVAVFFSVGIIALATTGVDIGVPPTLTLLSILLVQGIIMAVLAEGARWFVFGYGGLLAVSLVASAAVDGIGTGDAVVRVLVLETLYALTAWFIVGFVGDLHRSMESLEALARRERALSEAAAILLQDADDQLDTALDIIAAGFDLESIRVVPPSQPPPPESGGNSPIRCRVAPQRTLAWSPGAPESTRLMTTFADMVAASMDRRFIAAELAAVVESKSRLVSLVSHELRTPLSGILGFAEILHGTADRSEAAEYLALLTREAHDMSDIIEDLLTGALASTGSLAVNVEPVDVTDEIHGSFSSWPERFAEESRRLVFESPARPTTAVADPLRVRQIVRNLLTNAQRYGGTNVTVTTVEDGDGIAISVIDDGPGVPPEDAETIFEPYRRGAGNAPTESVGIGLAVCADLARLQGGDLTYERDGERTVFRLRLPSAPVPASELSR